VGSGLLIKLRHRLAVVFEDEEPRSRATCLFNALLACLIVASVLGVLLESVETIRRDYGPAFDAFEAAVTVLFAAEYLLRVWVCVDYRDGGYSAPLTGRLRYMRSFFALVDLVAVLPALLGFLGAADLRVLRLLRLLRMLKLVRHSRIFGLLGAVLREEARSIGALMFILVLAVTISGALMYMIEGTEQPEVFSSIPAAMWWAVETLTTVGYGDMVPATAVGRLLGSMISVIGIATLALFSGVLTVAFLDQLKHYRSEHATAHFELAGQPVSAAPPGAAPAHAGNGGFIAPAALAVTDGAPAAGSAVCPHCGSVLLAAAPRPQAAPATLPLPPAQA